MAEEKKMNGSSLVHSLELRHRITNITGIPVVFVYFLYTMSGGTSALAANWKQIIPLVITSTLIILVSVIVHERINRRLWGEAKNFLDEPERRNGESIGDFNRRARGAIVCLLDFPLKSAGVSLLTWPSTIAVIVLHVWLLYFKYPLSLMLVMILGAVSAGIMVAVFQFYLFKQGAQPFLKEIVKAHPQHWKEDEFFRTKLGIRKKMLASFVLLMFVMMTMMAVMIYFDSGKLVMSQWGEMQRDRIERELVKYAPDLIKASSREERRAIIDKMDIDFKGERIYLTDAKGNSLLPGNLSKVEKEILLRIAGVKRDVKIGKDLTLMSPIPGKRNLALDLEPKDMMLNFWVNVPGSEYIVVGRRSFRSFTPQMTRIIAVSVFLVLAGIFLSILFTYSASRDVTAPLDELVVEIEKVSRGELSRELRLLTYDEVGLLAVHLRKMVENLRSMIRQIGDASARVEEATVSIVAGFKRVSEGSRTQSISVDETSATMEEMNASIKGIGENVETLASTAQQSSASIMEMSATIEEVADNVENLATSVEETTSSIAEMAASIRQVAENVENLSRKAEGTVSSVTEMEASIKEVQAGAEETAQLSEQVAEDADSGAGRVQDTIAGIRRAREDSELAVRVIHELAQRAEEIGNILTVIDDVTDETNLLALNAAIIAAQAGEHGRGFAVVADEIKDLAERTAQSTQEIQQLIEAVQHGAREAVEAVSRGYDAVERGAKLGEEAGQALTKILESARKSTERASNIAAATVEQAKRTKDVLKFFEEISENIRQVEVATREQSKGAEQIQSTAERMKEIANLVKRATQEQFLGSKQITQAMENINHIVAFINSSQQEQIKNAEQVVEAIQEIRAIASQNEGGVEEMFQASANLSSLAEDLRSMVQAFKLEQSDNA